MATTTTTHDSYYRDLRHLSADERARTNFDHPDSLETSLLVDHLRALRAGELAGLLLQLRAQVVARVLERLVRQLDRVDRGGARGVSALRRGLRVGPRVAPICKRDAEQRRARALPRAP